MAPLTLVDVIGSRAAAQPDDRAFALLSGRGEIEASLTFGELARKSAALAALLRSRGEPGDRALLTFPQGLDFLVAFLACALAGIVAVPIMVPRRARAQDSSDAIIADCEPRFALMNAALAEGARRDVAERFAGRAEVIVVDALTETVRERAFSAAGPLPDDVAFIQYTSGSTSNPKGVVVTHRNLLANLEMMRIALGNSARSTCVSWAPLYHDMGLILNALQSLYLGAPCLLMAPATFMQRPLLWLRAISEHRAEVAGAPNFAFDLCVSRFNAGMLRGVDLSCWKTVYVGAEPIRAETLSRFAETFAPFGLDAKSIYAGYGLAEATLMVSGGRRGQGILELAVSRQALERGRAARPTGPQDLHRLVGCGRALVGEEIAIVDSESRRRCPAGEVGEIWINGPNVAQGYWRNAEATKATFEAEIEGEPGRLWLRTGDLGFLDEGGELYVTGRIKDIIIIRGANHYPQDIEHTVETSHPALRLSGAAVFTASLPGADREERLIVVQEIERAQRYDLDFEEVAGNIREAVAEAHELSVAEVVLIRPGTLPKTTSGKVQRRRTRQLWLAGQLELAMEPRVASRQRSLA